MGRSELCTERLLLRRWRLEDLEPFARMNADPAVMEHFPSTLSRDETEQRIERIEAHFEEKGFGLFAVEVPGVADFVGFVGLSTPRFESHFTPCVEIGWRLAVEHQGCGYATEGARAVLEFGFERVGLEEIVSFTVPANLPSRRVMERIGMERDVEGDFDHPSLADGHPLRRHVLYRSRHPRALG